MIYVTGNVVELNGGHLNICPFLIPKPREYNLIWKKGLSRCNYIKDLETVSSWIIQGGLKFNDECPYKREKKTDIKRRTCEKRQSYADTSQGMPGANRS